MSTIREEREAIAGILNLIPGLTGYPVWPNQIETPAGIVKPHRREVETFGNPPGITRVYQIEILVAAQDVEDTQDTLDRYLEEEGDYSVVAAFAIDPTLGGIVANSDIVTWERYGARRAEVETYFTAVFTIEVYV